LNDIHSIYFDGFGYIVSNNNVIQGEFSDWSSYLINRFEHNINFAHKVLSYDQIKKTKNYFYNNLYRTNAVQKGVLIHNDIKSDNLIYNKDDNILYIIDWEEAIIGDRLAEYASILNRISTGRLPECFLNKEWVYNKTIKFYRVVFIVNEIGWLIRHYFNKDVLIKERSNTLLQLINK